MKNQRSALRSAASLLVSGSLAFSLVALAPSVAHAGDVKLPNGTVWRGSAGDKVRVTYLLNGREVVVEGTVVKIEASFIRVDIGEGGKSLLRTISTFDLKKLEALGAADATSKPAPAGSGAAPSGSSGAAPAAGGAAKTGEAAASTAKVPSIFVLPWEGMVGIGARHDEIAEIGKEADKLGPGQIIVLQIDSPGGLVIEGDKIHDTLVDLKKRHRVVAWIKKAISAGAFTALHLDEIYFMRVGTLGSITMFSGAESIKGPELQAWLDKVGEVTEMGGRPGMIGRAMVTMEPELSYDRDEEGNITWYDTMQGKYDLSDRTQNLTFTAETASHSKFSDGTADTLQELAPLLQLKEWKEASDVGRRIHERWQRAIRETQAAKPRLVMDWQNPAGSDPETQLASQIKAGMELLKLYDRCHPVMYLEAPNLPYEKKVIEDEVERLKRLLSRLKKAQRE